MEQVPLGDASTPADSPSGSCSASLASRRRLYVSIVKGSMRLESMFQCLLEGGQRYIDILGPAADSGETSLACTPAWVWRPPLRDVEKQPDEPGPLQAAGSTQYGA